MSASRTSRRARAILRERLALLAQLEASMEVPMLVLGFAWLALLVVELLRGLSPLLEALGTAIWVVFIVHFLIEFTLAPQKLPYLRRNWLTALSLLAPALRVFRVVRVARALRMARVARGLRLFRLVASVNRGLRALGSHMSRRGLGYVAALTLLVLVAGSAGMYAFETDPSAEGRFDGFGAALWWTATVLTTVGPEFWPRTPEGRVLGLLIAVYAFAVFGYFTAALASFFIGREARHRDGDLAGTEQIAQLSRELAALRRDLRQAPPTPSSADAQAGSRASNPAPE